MTDKKPQDQDYVPPLGRHGLTDQYDRAIALMTREKRWRSELIRRLPPSGGARIVDIGCGTGTLAIAIKQAFPDSEVIGIDPDRPALDLARGKAEAAGVAVQWEQAMGDRADDIVGSCDVIVSSLVFHQCAIETKQAIADAMFRALRSGGLMFVADYGLQRSLLMRTLFRQVQLLDGFDKTEPSAKGCMPGIFVAAGFAEVTEAKVIQTPTGSISIYEGRKDGAGTQVEPATSPAAA
ncbi:methylase involved in ubiquinone/menaquinone biosynthesis (plasmid) [Sphingopyxis fribergensis]|uniref:Methylase involved in ubiquinone/menaquinone biosynthesis n=1 Tax=Sphingopyxis fribergensis TaxID=1515612 RepID=A0A0A7PP21_9SPHN|nr:class I SAM-dependent methyltransferase [Sphingopyxis fribergensis]AJA11770.1 methylase involved in ubiquinone/menaquinone biosynthesis [Sphingopyxis fribergensis]